MDSSKGRILKGPPLFELKFPERNLGDFYFKIFDQYSTNIAQIDAANGKTQTYKTLKQDTTKVAINLRKDLVTINDYIVIISCKPIVTVIPLFASFFIGATVMIFDASEAVDQIKYKLELVKPKVIFVEEASINIIAANQFEAKIVVLGESVKYQELKEAEISDFKVATNIDSNSTAIIVFTSGSTGLSKPVCLSHNRILNHSRDDVAPGKMSVLAWRLSWIGPLHFVLSIIMKGGYLVYPKSPVTLYSICEAIEKYKISNFLILPYLAHSLTKSEDYTKYDLSSVNAFILSGNSTNYQQVKSLRQLFTKASFFISYGSTEVGPITNMLSSLVTENRKPGFCGKLSSGVQIKIIDIDTGELLSSNQRGEILVKTETMMSRFLNIADMSPYFDADGFYRINDYGYFDDDGNLYVLDKMDDVIRTAKCYSIYATKIEEVLMLHPNVKEAAAFSVDRVDVMQKYPAACVVLRDNNIETSVCEIQSFADERLEEDERLEGGIQIVEEIPKTATGKIIRRKAKELYLSL